MVVLIKLINLAVKIMNRATVLRKIENNELTAKAGYELMYPLKKQKIGKRAYFFKLKIKVLNESRGVNNLLRVLFILPVPLALLRVALLFSKRFVKNDEVDLKKLADLIKYSKYTTVSVISKEAIVDIKVI